MSSLLPLLHRRAAAVVLALAGAWPAAGARSADDAALAERHAQLRDDLANSPFGRPLLLRFEGDDAAPQGQVFAVLDHPMPTVARVLSQPQAWCAVLRLQTNVKRCEVQGDGRERSLRVGITRRLSDPVDSAQWLTLRFSTPRVSEQGLRADMQADQGPVGTRDYRLHFQAVPLDDGRVFVSLSYGYRTGSMAQWATHLYLSTSGRDKVGFTVTGHDDAGRPQHVGGIQGVAERNTMRYFLAIESVLSTWGPPEPRRLERRWRQYHTALERYPRQLRETSWEEYLALKRSEG